MNQSAPLVGIGTDEERAALVAFRSFRGMRETLAADLRANRGDPKSRVVLIGFRICQYLIRDRAHPRRRSYPAVAMYRFATEFILGIELRPKTRVGPGLTIFHGTGLVVNDRALIGTGVVLRNGVVIGHKRPEQHAPFLRDFVDIGTTALIVGAVTIGRGASVGAGAVVVRDVREGDTVVGNPARSVNP
ncbi:serine O-acetyltransferase [Microbacterium sp. M1A1_1b]|uniref:serine O-acetyltransferase n=1 Tax=Curtobacterium sp. VKM Ac-2922 TaxID=2929475 RepID=UPI001FB4A0BC|nr:hypothetical protein [Curtobacterium sp. VKM Ac-2922]MCJ1714151.1 hypothetical protein [Curtobacterium sp. VKM Ac-2922]